MAKKPEHGCEEYDTCVLDGDCPFFINCYLIEGGDDD